MRPKTIRAVMTLVLGLSLGACSDDTDPAADQGPGPDAARREAGVDAGKPDVGKLEAGAREAGAKEAGAMEAGAMEAGAPDMSKADAGTDATATLDQGPGMDHGAMMDGAGMDQTTTTPDQATTMPDQGTTTDGVTTGDGSTASNTTCQSAQVVTLSGGKATVSGSKGTGDQNALNTCGSTTLSATDLWYKFTPTVGKTYRITFSPGTGGGRFAAWEDNSYACNATSIATACGVLGSVFVSGNSTDSLYIKSTTGGDIYFVADGLSSSYDVYTFKFDVAEFTVATNSTCAKAQTLTLSGSPASATVTGDTTGTTDEYATVKCGGSSAFDGPQVYYQVSMKANQTYKITVSPSFYAYAYVFQAASCSAGAASIDTDCGSAGVTGEVSSSISSGSSGDMYFTPTTAGNYIIAVDSTLSTYVGSFSLKVAEFSPASNSFCTGAQTLTLSGSPAKASVTSDTSRGINQFGANVDCGGSTDFDGPQLYYKVALTGGQAYKLTLTTSFSAYMYVFQSAACSAYATINTSCGAGGGTGDYQYVSSSSSPGTVYFTPTSSGDYIVAIDSSAPSTSGAFTLAVETFTPATNSTCAKAQSVTLSGSPASATVTGDTSGTTDEYATVKCGKTSALAGPQVYYAVSLTANQTYKVSLSPQFTAYAYIFRGASCAGGATAIDTDCSASGGTGDVVGSVSSGKTLDLFFTPTTSGSYIIAVDSTSSSYKGGFTLKIAEFSVPSFSAPLSWDFESSCQGLAATGDWECGQLAFSAGSNCDSSYTAPTAGASGTGKGMWGTKLNDCYTPAGNNTGSSSSACSNTTPSDDSILSFKVTIPSAWTSATLTYSSWDDVNGYFDWMEIRVNNTSVKAFCNPSPGPTAWVKNTVDLSTYAGQTVTVAFHFLASTVVNYAGWYIDDVVISGS